MKTFLVIFRIIRIDPDDIGSDGFANMEVLNKLDFYMEASSRANVKKQLEQSEPFVVMNDWAQSTDRDVLVSIYELSDKYLPKNLWEIQLGYVEQPKFQLEFLIAGSSKRQVESKVSEAFDVFFDIQQDIDYELVFDIQ
jgi:hypothetical protein